MSRTRSGRRRQRTRDLVRPGRRPEAASDRSGEKRLGLRRARPSFFWRHGDRTDPLEFQAQVLEKLAHLAGTASQPGQLKDAFARLGHGTNGLLLEGLADQLAIGSHFADRAIDVPMPEAVQASLSERR